ncbi:ABC transporter ATP-binding protein/permease [Komagataeibacter intermedius]|uniref:ABC transporter ATP-binding protein n=2 Tax=Komagataeibacter intermedius TaxID=66229 RepID=A0A0N1N5H1_9PROT|nr:ABC transporter ATP-binding protein [Komagataeibacter intermedius]KPH88205.1 ABC transporter ATP-binding protein [Komagataeibacter intermedius AF2]MCF3635865.1 ABC transporter ATP-binding protein/permease [Komagataeibacter intermedius]GAN86248.1 ABC transporter [Komagataeibacter intermedius TF2]
MNAAPETSDRDPSPPSWRTRLGARFGVYGHVPRMFRQIWNCSPALTLASIALRLLQAIQPPLALYVGKLIVDEVIRTSAHAPASGSMLDWVLHGPATRLEEWIGLEFALIILSDLTSRAIVLVDGLLNERYINSVSLALMAHSATLDLQQFESSTLQDLLERARRQASGRNNLLVQLFNIAQTAVTALTLAIGVVAFAPWMVVVLAVALLPSAAGEARFNAEGYRLIRAKTAERREMEYLRYVGASAEHAKELKLFGLGDFLVGRFRAAASTVLEQNRRLALRRFVWSGAFATIGSVAYYGVYLVIVWDTVRGRFSVGDLTFLSGSFLRLHSVLSSLLLGITQTASQAQYLNDFFAFLDLRPAIVSSPRALPFPSPIRQGIRFENVGFRYPGTDRWAIRHLDLTIGAGETVALVGENGAGKTTIVKLLTRLYDPDEGQITVDGVPLGDMDLTDLRAHIGVIFQDFVRYSLTASENIAVGRIDALSDTQRIEAAAHEGLADDVVGKLPMGYDQPLGKRVAKGRELSGGEWQKIAISRAYMRDADLLILDEPTAALDARAESDVFERLRALRRGKAALVISHRFSTVRTADRIVVLEHGKILQAGTHEDLLAQGGRYAELFELQAAGYQ